MNPVDESLTSWAIGLASLWIDWLATNIEPTQELVLAFQGADMGCTSKVQCVCVLLCFRVSSLKICEPWTVCKCFELAGC